MTSIFLGLGKLFTWSFQVLPPIGILVNWLLVIIGFFLFIWWNAQLNIFGSKDSSMEGNFESNRLFKFKK